MIAKKQNIREKRRGELDIEEEVQWEAIAILLLHQCVFLQTLQRQLKVFVCVRDPLFGGVPNFIDIPGEIVLLIQARQTNVFPGESVNCEKNRKGQKRYINRITTTRKEISILQGELRAIEVHLMHKFRNLQLAPLVKRTRIFNVALQQNVEEKLEAKLDLTDEKECKQARRTKYPTQ
jgi:hypothetical protein